MEIEISRRTTVVNRRLEATVQSHAALRARSLRWLAAVLVLVAPSLAGNQLSRACPYAGVRATFCFTASSSASQAVRSAGSISVAPLRTRDLSGGAGGCPSHFMTKHEEQ